MPLNKSSSAAAFSENVAAERTAKKPLKQALAIAYRVQRDARQRRAEGGPILAQGDDADIPTQAAPSPANLDAAHAAMNLTPQERALYERHLSNLYGPGGVDNPNGSRSTLSQLSFKNLSDGKYYNVPMVYDGKIMEPDAAIDFAKAQGINQFPSYADEETAEKRYQQMHSFMEKDTADYFARRGGRASGGRISPYARKYAPGGSIPTPFFARQGASMLGHTGMVHSATGGRSDKVPMGVKPQSYVLPADVVSGIGHGNSMAGAAALNQLFKAGPYGSSPVATRGVSRAPMSARAIRQKFAAGGPAVPIVASGGEYIVEPSVIEEIGDGDIARGHEILDQMVKHIRSKTIKTLRKLPPPKKK